MKTILIATSLLFAAAPALAGPYVNIESNSGFSAGDYTSTLLENHVGYEGELGESATWYVQGGPALEFVDGSGTESKVSGKVGANVALSEKLDGYGKLAVISAEGWDIGDSDVGIKAGLKYTF